MHFKLPLRVPLSPTEISLNGSVVQNDTEWYSMVISGIPLALFCKGSPFKRYQMYVFVIIKTFKARISIKHATNCPNAPASICDGLTDNLQGSRSRVARMN